MKKNFNYFLCAWFIGIIAFNAIFFVVGKASPIGFYWPGYIASMISFFILLGCGYITFSRDSLKKAVYSAPSVVISYSGLLSVISISIFIAVRKYIDNWIGICLLILSVAITLIKVIGSQAAASTISYQEKKTAAKRSFVIEMISQAEILLSTASEEMKPLCKKVYESLRYTDPMSSADTEAIEQDLWNTLQDFKTAVEANNTDNAAEICSNLINKVNTRAILVKKGKS